jgi:hypothetical protein
LAIFYILKTMPSVPGGERRELLFSERREVAVVLLAEPVAALRVQGDGRDHQGREEGAQASQVRVAKRVDLF